MKLGFVAAAFVAAVCIPVQAKASSDTPQPKKFSLDMPEEFPTFKELDEILGQYKSEPKMTLKLTENLTIGRVRIEPFEKYVNSSTNYRQIVGVSVSFKF